MTPEQAAKELVGRWGYEEPYWWGPIAAIIHAQRAERRGYTMEVVG
jgi:hypothetical protein